ncbi:hypothetical protein GOP47_0028322 [Adiantum capillus-veneris]|nr:hypothetical protein GOP47_0028322 [Adiantum capillus-veneris]
MPEKASRRKLEQNGNLLLRKELLRKEQDAPPTPSPTWKLYENPSFHMVAAAVMAATSGSMECEVEEAEKEEQEEDFESFTSQRRQDFEGLHGPALYNSFVSAHKLAVPLQDEEGQGNSPVRRCRFLETSPCSHLQPRPSSLSNSESPASINHHHISSKRDSAEELGDSPGIDRSSDSRLSASPCSYIKAFSRFSLDSSQHDSFPVESDFSEELQRALSRVRQVEAAQISARKDVDILLRRCADEITMLRAKEQEKVKATVLFIAEELEMEREARKNAEVERERLANCVADANKAVLATERELEKERQSRLLMEAVCNELANKIGEDKTEVEELKRELAKARDEIEEERKAIHVAEAWREERVQIKLAEAKLELDERCIALDRLKMKLQCFLSKEGVHRAGRRGKSLESVVKRVQEQMSTTLFFQKEAGFQLSPDEDALSGNIGYSQWSKSDWSSIARPAYDRKYEKGTGFLDEWSGSDLDPIVDSNRCARESCNWLEFKDAHLDEHRSQRPKQASRRRRNKASIKSYRSKTKELSSLGGKDFVEDSIDFLDRNRHRSNDSGSEGDSPSECNIDEQEEDKVSAESSVGTWRQRQREIMLWSTKGLDEPEASSSKVEQICNMKGTHGAARTKHQLFCGQGAVGAERCHYRTFHANHVPSRRKEDIFATERVSEILSLTEPSPASKGHMPSPELQMGDPCIVNPDKHSVSWGRRAVFSSVGQSKPYKRNSLHVKLLLEDKMLE